MKDLTRINRKRNFGRLYKRLEGAADVCWYCGDIRECLDHVPPLKLVEALDLAEFRKRGGVLELVPSCAWCNTRLGSRMLPTKEDRMLWLYNYVNRKLEKQSKASWSKEELNELGRVLKNMVKNKIAQRRILIQKLRGIERRINDLVEYALGVI